MTKRKPSLATLQYKADVLARLQAKVEKVAEELALETIRVRRAGATMKSIAGAVGCATSRKKYSALKTSLDAATSA